MFHCFDVINMEQQNMEQKYITEKHLKKWENKTT